MGWGLPPSFLSDILSTAFTEDVLVISYPVPHRWLPLEPSTAARRGVTTGSRNWQSLTLFPGAFLWSVHEIPLLSTCHEPGSFR
jgi:hypothetical protein